MNRNDAMVWCRVSKCSLNHHAPAEGRARQVRYLALGGGSFGSAVENADDSYGLVTKLQPDSQ
jgi:hypothetical protein